MTSDHPVPKSPLDLFTSFTMISLQGFGGVLAIIQNELVDKRQWLTREEFIEEWAIAQILPGPNVVNLSLMLGARYFGIRGSLAALAGMLLIPSIVALLFGVLCTAYADVPEVAGAIRGMSAVAAGLIIATGIKLLTGLKTNPLGTTLCALFSVLCFLGIAIIRWPLLDVLAMSGPIACLIVYRRLQHKKEQS